MNILAPIKCAKCGSDDQDKFVTEIDRKSHGRRTVALVGWRCQKCGHVTPDPIRS